MLAGDPSDLPAVLLTGVSHGSLALRPDGGFLYTPATDYVGTDSFNYLAVKGLTNLGVATVTVSMRSHKIWFSD